MVAALTPDLVIKCIEELNLDMKDLVGIATNSNKASRNFFYRGFLCVSSVSPKNKTKT